LLEQDFYRPGDLTVTQPTGQKWPPVRWNDAARQLEDMATKAFAK